MSQTTFWRNSFLSVDVCQQAIWFSVLHWLYMEFSGQILICYLFIFGIYQQKPVGLQSENYAKSAY